MNLTISGHHVDGTQANRQHVEGTLVPRARHGDNNTRIELPTALASCSIDQIPTAAERL